jgi:uncharacterized protein
VSSVPLAPDGVLPETPEAGGAGVPAPRARTRVWVQLVWCAAAFLSSLCGIGGGLFAVPILHYLGGMPLRRAVATSLCLVFLLTLTSSGVEFFHSQSALRPSVVATLLVGGFVGTKLGLNAAPRVNVIALKRVFVLVLIFSAVRIFGLDALSDKGAGAGVEVGAATVLVVLSIGFLGGFISPLLGVGGGLLVIPALFLSLPTITYLEARACSMAMTVFVSLQSAQAYWTAGQVERKVALRFAPWTIVGSLGGVLSVHRPGWAEGARVAMGVVLVLVALRFLLDVVSARRGLELPQA